MISLFTDSAANLPKEIIQKYNINVVSFSYSVNGSEEDELAVNFDGKLFYDAMRNGAQIKTSMVNITKFFEAFEKELLKGKDILYIGLSGGVSGTANAAKIAAEELKVKYPDRKICAIDSLGASLGEGLLVIKAAKNIKKGIEFDKIIKKIYDAIPLLCQCFTVDDLKYLKSTGRVSGAAAFVGGLLGIKPLLIGNEYGKIVVYDKIRGAKKALDALAERYANFVTDKARDIGIAHADNIVGVEYLLEKLKEKGFCGKSLTVCYEPVTGSHVGPGTIALFFYGKGRV
ncbi:MAG: DegV family protein [Clostridia bacterium]|nr:DegV family protein [Clostridia bacterium]